jgi:hypothetical protein
MSIEAACQIISAVGRYADTKLTADNADLFDVVDYINRTTAASVELREWVRGKLAGIPDRYVSDLCILIAQAMAEQNAHDAEEDARLDLLEKVEETGL